ncbi:MAG: putative DNA binding domain-containing protein [Bacteroidales bacterium]|jgi:ATP-dependent DNA helicase RecG|nr:putative DNA binding domain-containing protein [Bacteroidales bacterium]
MYMTISDIEKIINQGEGVSIEFKKAKEKVPQSLYETVVSFANTNGGIILLGVDDDGTISGIAPELKTQFLKNIATALNSIENINPVMYLNPTAVEYQGKIIVSIQVPASSQVHDHSSRVYIREYETDIDVTNNQHKIRGLFLKKGMIYTETHIYPGLKMSDLDGSLFDKARNLIRSNRNDHPWLTVDNMQMLRDAVLYWNDYEQNKEGFTLAAALLFGKDLTIQNLLPAYKVEAMVRIRNKDRWDDRLTLRTNLIDTYLQLKEFINRHLPDKFFMEGDQRIDLRDKIFREVISNIICHREYTDGTATELIIEEDAVRTLNPNNPWFNGVMDLENFNPHPKNPNLRRFFTALGWADEIGSGIRNTKKYLPFYVENATPIFIDALLFRTVIPLVRHTMADFTNEWFKWLELDEKWRPKLSESLKNIEIDGQLHTMNWEEQISCLTSSWMKNGTKLRLSLGKKGTNPENYYTIENKLNSNDERLNQNEKLTNLAPSPAEKGTKLPNKRLQYLLVILFVLGTPLSIDDLIDVFDYRDKGKFRQNYLKPLETVGLIRKTNPDKPTASNQKYVITEAGKQFLTGQEFY